MSEYSVEEVRAKFEAHHGITWEAIQSIPIGSGSRMHLESHYKRHFDTWQAAYAERIKAYEEAVPAAEVYEYPRDHHEFNAPMLKGIRFTGMPLPVGAKLYAHPPAQVAQGDLVAWQIDTNDDVERVSKASGWDNRRYMTQADYAIWCNRMREFVRIAVDVPQPFLAAQPRTVPDDEIRSLIARLRHEDDSEDPVTSERRAGWRAALNAVDEAMFPAAPSPGESA